MKPRLVEASSQYVFEDMREFSALDANPLALKAAIAKQPTTTTSAATSSAAMSPIVYSNYATDRY